MLLYDLLDKLSKYKEVVIKAVNPKFDTFNEIRILNLVAEGCHEKNWTFKYSSYLTTISGKDFEVIEDPKRVGYVKTWKSWKALLKKIKEELPNAEVKEI